MDLVRGFLKLVLGILIGVSILIVGIAVASNIPTTAGYILIIGSLVGCYLSTLWGFNLVWKNRA